MCPVAPFISQRIIELDVVHVDGNCFAAAKVQRFEAWLTVAYPEALAEIPDHERRYLTARCVRHLEIKARVYRSPSARRWLARRKEREGDVADDGEE